MKRLLALLLFTVMLPSCVIWPDPYRMEIYVPTHNVAKIGKPPFTSISHSAYLIGDDYVRIFIQNSGINDDEAFGPYKTSLWLFAGDSKVDSVLIHKFYMKLNDKLINDVSLHNIKTKNEIKIPGPINELLHESPYRIKMSSNFIELGHVVGDQLTVTIELETNGLNGNYRRVIERNFKAVVKQGIFQGDLGPLR